VHLERLDVSANEMDRFQPGARADALQILQAYSNRFASLGTLPSLPEARFLGFGFNELSALPADLGRRCPNLASLDLAFNHLLSLDDVVACLRKCRKLKQVFLAGNPCSLLPNYRVRLVTQLPALETVDDAEVTAAEREEYVLPEGGFKEDLDGFVTIEVSLKSLAGLPAPEGADSAPNSRPGTGRPRTSTRPARPPARRRTSPRSARATTRRTTSARRRACSTATATRSPGTAASPRSTRRPRKPAPGRCPCGTSASAAGQQKRAKFPTSKAPISAVFHSFWLILGRAIISRDGLEALMLFPERARA
jgi:Leucine-rich repeat (LRR) protein